MTQEEINLKCQKAEPCDTDVPMSSNQLADLATKIFKPIEEQECDTDIC